MVERTEPAVLTVQRFTTEPAVLARRVQFHERPNGTEFLAVPLAPTVSPAAFWTVSTSTTDAGPEMEPVAVAVLPDTVHRVLVGMTAFALVGLPPPLSVNCLETFTV